MEIVRFWVLFINRVPRTQTGKFVPVTVNVVPVNETVERLLAEPKELSSKPVSVLVEAYGFRTILLEFSFVNVKDTPSDSIAPGLGTVRKDPAPIFNGAFVEVPPKIETLAVVVERPTARDVMFFKLPCESSLTTVLEPSKVSRTPTRVKSSNNLTLAILQITL